MQKGQPPAQKLFNRSCSSSDQNARKLVFVGRAYALMLQIWAVIAAFAFLCGFADCQTNAGDVTALTSLSRALFSSASPAIAPANWTSSFDPCGQSSCWTAACNMDLRTPANAGLPACNWAGVCCVQGRITSISLEPAEAAALRPTLPSTLQQLTSLVSLHIPQHG